MALNLAIWATLFFAGVAPCGETIRLWLLRIGLYLLKRAVPVHGEWSFMVDLTVQLGSHKCIVVLGAPLCKRQAALGHHDVQVLTVRVLEHSNGEAVQEELDKAAARVGCVPKQIVSDHGPDVQRGIRLYQDQEGNADVVATYDVTHLLACLLKAELEPDSRWQEFVQHCQQTRQQLQQTKGMFLEPPAWRQKARYLNVETDAEHFGASGPRSGSKAA